MSKFLFYHNICLVATVCWVRADLWLRICICQRSSVTLQREGLKEVWPKLRQQRHARWQTINKLTACNLRLNQSIFWTRWRGQVKFRQLLPSTTRINASSDTEYWRHRTVLLRRAYEKINNFLCLWIYIWESESLPTQKLIIKAKCCHFLKPLGLKIFSSVKQFKFELEKYITAPP